MGRVVVRYPSGAWPDEALERSFPMTSGEEEEFWGRAKYLLEMDRFSCIPFPLILIIQEDENFIHSAPPSRFLSNIYSDTATHGLTPLPPHPKNHGHEVEVMDSQPRGSRQSIFKP